MLFLSAAVNNWEGSAKGKGREKLSLGEKKKQGGTTKSGSPFFKGITILKSSSKSAERSEEKKGTRKG